MRRTVFDFSTPYFFVNSAHGQNKKIHRNHVAFKTNTDKNLTANKFMLTNKVCLHNSASSAWKNAHNGSK